MIRLMQVLVSTGLMFVAPHAIADSTVQPTMSKHQMVVQMVDCVKKRMSADKSHSYAEAMKACKDEMKKEGDELPTGALVASEAQPKQ